MHALSQSLSLFSPLSLPLRFLSCCLLCLLTLLKISLAFRLQHENIILFWGFFRYYYIIQELPRRQLAWQTAQRLSLSSSLSLPACHVQQEARGTLFACNSIKSCACIQVIPPAQAFDMKNAFYWDYFYIVSQPELTTRWGELPLLPLPSLHAAAAQLKQLCRGPKRFQHVGKPARVEGSEGKRGGGGRQKHMLIVCKFN